MSSWDPDEATPYQDNRPDAAIVPYVEALRDHGIETLQSCAGHVHEDGRLSEGHLWFRAFGTFEPKLAAKCDPLSEVMRRYVREECWQVTFPGHAEGPDALHEAMRVVFGSLGLDEPPNEPPPDVEGACSACGGPIDDMLRLPGGTEVRADGTPFSTDTGGVEAFRACRVCGREADQ